MLHFRVKELGSCDRAYVPIRIGGIYPDQGHSRKLAGQATSQCQESRLAHATGLDQTSVLRSVSSAVATRQDFGRAVSPAPERLNFGLQHSANDHQFCI